MLLGRVTNEGDEEGPRFTVTNEVMRGVRVQGLGFRVSNELMRRV